MRAPEKKLSLRKMKENRYYFQCGFQLTHEEMLVA